MPTSAPGETLTITLSGVPAGATLSAGVDNHDGTFTLQPSELVGLTLTPPADYSGHIALSVTASAALNGGLAATTTAALDVAVTPDMPTLTVTAAAGLEDHAIPLTIAAGLVAPTPGETLTITLAGVPTGATLSAGIDNHDGTFTLQPSELAGLTLTPPTDYSGHLALSVTATATTDGLAATTTAALDVAVTPVADMPILTVLGASGLEDHAIALTITAALPTSAPGETLTITLSGVPTGATLSAGVDNHDGTFTLQPSELVGLTLTPPTDYSGHIALSVTASAALNGGPVATTTAALDVAVTPDMPTLTVTAAAGLEDHAIPLTIAAGLVAPTPGETLTITLAGVPTGATLSAGIDNLDGTFTLQPSELAGLTLTPPTDYSGHLALSVTATATTDGLAATTTAALDVAVTPVAHVPTLTVSAAAGLEDHAIALTISAGLVAPAPGETLTITLSGVPTGATLSAGVDNHDGTYTLQPSELAGLTLTPPADYSGHIALSVTASAAVDGGAAAATTAAIDVAVIPLDANVPTLMASAAIGIEDHPVALTIAAALPTSAPNETLTITLAGVPTGATLSAGILNRDGTYTLQPSELAGLTLTPPTDYSGHIALTVTATAALLGGSATTTTAALDVVVAPIAHVPDLQVSATGGFENTPIALAITSGAPHLGETVTVTIAGVPAGASLSAGTVNPDGSWTLAAADLTGLSLTPAHNFHGTIALSVTAISTDGAGDVATTHLPLNLTVAAVAATPSLDVTAATGLEGAPIALTIAAAAVGGDPLTVSIAGVPADATLSAGVRQGDGSWSLSATDLPGLSLATSPHFNGALALTVTATTTEANGSSAQTSVMLPVAVQAVASTPSLHVSAATGLENATSIPVAITAALADPSEILSVAVTGVPTGATLSAGSLQPDGSWLLTPAQLHGLSLTPAAHFSGTLTLTVTAQSLEPNGSHAEISAPLTVTVAPVAEAPSLTVAPATGVENGAIALSIATALVSPVAGETLSVTLGGVPTDATLSAGVHNADGTWTLTAAQLNGLTLTPANGFSGDLQLSVNATAAVAGTQAATSAPLAVHVASAAITPIVSGTAASGAEDTAIALDLHAALPAGTVNQALTFSLSGVPAGATLSAGTYEGHGTWALTPGQLVGLTLTPPLNFTGTAALTLEATTVDAGGATATTSFPTTVTVVGVADAPTLQVASLIGREDTPLPLAIGLALSDPGGSEHLGSVTITGVPTGATLSAGTHNPDGSWTLAPTQLAGLLLTPAPHSIDGFTLSVSATSVEPNGSTATAMASIPVTLTGIAEVPTVSALNATGLEGAVIPLSVAGTQSANVGADALSYVIHGVPNGFALNHGSNNGDNSWTLSQADLSGLSLTTPVKFNGTVTLYATSVAHELGGDTQASAATAFTVGIGNPSAASVNLGLDAHVGGVGVGVGVDLQLPSGGLLASGGVFVKEDTPFVLPDAAQLLTLPVVGAILPSTIVGVVFSGLPAGATLSSGTHLSDGSWLVLKANLSGLTLTPPANSDGDFTITSSLKLLAAANVALQSTTVHVMGVADLPTLSASALAVSEGTPVPLWIGGALTDTDGSETLSYSISGLPAGASLSAGTNNGNGSWSLTAAQLTNLTLITPAGFSGTTSLKVEAVSTEREGSQAVTALTVPITVAAVANGVTIGTAAVTGSDAAAIPLHLSVALKDTGGSEQLSSVVIGGVPAGATLTHATANQDGTWTVDVAHLGDVALVPAAHASGTFALTVTATDTVSANGAAHTTTATLPLHITAALDAPALTATAAVGLDGSAIPLSIGTHLLDANAPQTLTVRIDGVPAGATLSAGTHAADGAWVLTASQLTGLTVTPLAGHGSDFTLTVTAIAHDPATGLDAQATSSLGVTVLEPPTLAVQAAAGVIGSPVALNVSAALTALEPNTALVVTVAGVPTGATLSAGTHNPDGSWSLTSAQVAGLTLTAPTGTAQAFTLAMTAHAHDSVTGLDAATTVHLPVALESALAVPTLSVAAAYGAEDQPVALTIGASLADAVTIPTESLAVTVAGLPAAASLSAGTHNADGTWSLTAAQLNGLTLTPAPHTTGDTTLTVTATAHDSVSGLQASSVASLHVATITALDAPVLHAAAVAGFENLPIDLGLSATVAQALPTETVSVALDGLPAGASLSAGTHNADGSWTVDASHLAGLQLTAPHDYAGSLAIHVQATAHDSVTGLSAVSSATLAVTVLEPVAAPHLAAVSSVTDGHGDIPLSISASLGDHNASESLSINVSGLPQGAVLSAGIHNADGSYTLGTADLSGLHLTQPSAAHDFTLAVAATVHEALTNTTSHASINLPVSFSDHAIVTPAIVDTAHLSALAQHVTPAH